MKLKTGFTTGTCAQGAAKAAARMLITQTLSNSVQVETPSGKRLTLKLIDQEIGDDFARCAVVKDAGDDPDVTDGTKIYADVRFSPSKDILIKGGEGIGKVTKPGLPVKIGDWAINPIPRRMIMKEVARFLPREKGFEVTISVPEGENLAMRTFNPKLGIVGGISIIGTTGIVEPKSLDAYKASLSLQMDVLVASGRTEAVLVLGYVGERFCKDRLKIDEESIIKIGDHVGFMLRECANKKIDKVLLVGHIGKLIKIAGGQFDTHNKFGDNRITLLADYAKTCGADEKIIEDILKIATAEATIDILRKNGLMEVFERIAQDVSKAASRFVENRVKIGSIVLSLEGEVLGNTKPI